eukprot:scaffold183868_cov35-Tisochrysis_lutea.AAC.4
MASRPVKRPQPTTPPMGRLAPPRPCHQSGQRRGARHTRSQRIAHRPEHPQLTSSTQSAKRCARSKEDAHLVATEDRGGDPRKEDDGHVQHQVESEAIEEVVERLPIIEDLVTISKRDEGGGGEAEEQEQPRGPSVQPASLATNATGHGRSRRRRRRRCATPAQHPARGRPAAPLGNSE